MKNETMQLGRRTFLKRIGLGAGGLALASGLPGKLLAEEHGGRPLPRSRPESQHVSSEGILAFLTAVEEKGFELHSFMIARHGKVIAEGWWSPYEASLVHSLYSLSKSFTSTAVGMAIAEGKFSVDQSVTSFFAGDLPGVVSENLSALRVKHLLTMSTGQAADPTHTMVKEQNWARAFLAQPFKNAPGSAFLYNSGATYMLSAIVQKMTGQKVIDFLTPRLFEPLGIEGMTWETCPRGINTGGWGLSVKTEDIEKFGELYLNKGEWRGKQLVSAEWVEQATSFKIQQPAHDLKRPIEESDWHQGYCYQFWRCRHNAYRGDGAFGQFCVVIPEKDAVVAITGESSDLQGELDLVWEHLLPAMQDHSVKRNRDVEKQLKDKIASLALKPPQGQATSPLADTVSGKTFKLAGNDLGAQTAEFKFKDSSCSFTLKDANGEHPIECGLGAWLAGETTMPGTPPRLIGGKTDANSKVAASGTWKDDKTFEMTWRFCETPHHDTVTCQFDGDKVSINFMNSIAQLNPSGKEPRSVLQGKVAS